MRPIGPLAMAIRRAQRGDTRSILLVAGFSVLMLAVGIIALVSF